MLDCVRKSDTVSRLGGDEFGIIQTNLNSEVGVEVLARRIINSISQPFSVDGERVYTGTSIGITVFPHDDRETVSDLRTQSSNRSATCFKSASPAGWPNVSFTSLK